MYFATHCADTLGLASPIQLGGGIQPSLARGQPPNHKVGLGWVKAAHALQLPQLYLLLRTPPLPSVRS